MHGETIKIILNSIYEDIPELHDHLM